MATAAVRPSLGLSRLLQSTSISSPSTSTSLTRSIIASTQQSTSFSTTAPLAKRKKYKTRDNNRLRGVSSINRTGPREPLSVSSFPLPRPREKPDEKLRPIDESHPLWEFFYKPGELIPEPADDNKHGRGWVAEELRKKSWDDLHRLWYKCLKELNRIATASYARKKFDVGFGGYEGDGRRKEVRMTMRGIKHVLSERYYAWEDAVELAKSDPEINLAGKGGEVYKPQQYLEDEDVFEDEVEEKIASPAVVPGEASEQKAIDPVAIPGEAAPGKGAEQSAPKP